MAQVLASVHVPISQTALVLALALTLALASVHVTLLLAAEQVVIVRQPRSTAVMRLTLKLVLTLAQIRQMVASTIPRIQLRNNV